MKKFTYFILAGMLFVWSQDAFSAFKWSADASQSFTFRDHFDLNNDGNNAVQTRGLLTFNGTGADSENFFTTLLGINGQWDLVKDTSLAFRVASQFDWLGTNTAGPAMDAQPGSGSPNTGNSALGGLNTFNLMVNQLFLNFNDFAGFPVNLRFGRQNVVLGKGFVLANRLFGAGSTIYGAGIAPSGSNAAANNGQNQDANAGNLPLDAISGGSLLSPETSDFTGFDGLTANLHLMNNKLNLDFGYLLIASALTEADLTNGSGTLASGQRDLGADDDETLWFANLGYKERKWNAEAYALYNHDREPYGDRNAAVAGSDYKSDHIWTLGLRGDLDFGTGMWKFKKVNVYGEGAYQLGKLGSGWSQTANQRDRQAAALNVGADAWLDMAYAPMFGLEAIYYSGMNPDKIEPNDNPSTATVGAGEKWTVWDPQFSGKFYAKIMPFLDAVYITDQSNINGSGNLGRIDAGFTNRMVLKTSFGFEPMKKLSAGGAFIFAQAADLPQAGAKKDLGYELDWDLGYKLSSKTTWSFDGGLFIPGSYYKMFGAGGTGEDAISNALLLRTGFKLDLG